MTLSSLFYLNSEKAIVLVINRSQFYRQLTERKLLSFPPEVIDETVGPEVKNSYDRMLKLVAFES